MLDRAAEARRADYRHIVAVPTRWADNDVYGHVNNVAYYAFFDTAINMYLIGAGGLDITGGPAIGVAAESQCRFLRPLQFPETVEVALRAGRLGTSSVRYELAVFGAGSEEPAAVGAFAHVFVDRQTRRPTPIPRAIRAALERLL